MNRKVLVDARNSLRTISNKLAKGGDTEIKKQVDLTIKSITNVLKGEPAVVKKRGRPKKGDDYVYKGGTKSPKLMGSNATQPATPVEPVDNAAPILSGVEIIL